METVDQKKKDGVEGDKQKNKKSTVAENICLKQKAKATQHSPHSRYTETAWPTCACARMHETTGH